MFFSQAGSTIQEDQEEIVKQVENIDNAEQVGIGYVTESDGNRISIQGFLYLGVFYQSKRKFEEAIKNFKEAVKIANETDHNDLQVEAYQHLANVYIENSPYMKDDWELTVYLWLGSNYLEARRYKICVEYYNKAVKLASQLGDQKHKLIAYFGLGNAFRFTEKYDSSQKYYLKALFVAEQIADKAAQRDAYKHLGHVYFQSCKFDAALQSYLKAREISHNLGQETEEAHAFLKLGETFQQLGKDEEAIEFFQKAIKIGKELEDQDVQRKAVQGLGTLYLNSASDLVKVGDDERAVEWYEKALSLFQTEWNEHLELLYEKVLTGLGIAWFHLGDTEKAIKSIQEVKANVQKEFAEAGKYTRYRSLVSGIK